MKRILPLFALISLFIFSDCSKNKNEPFEYPEPNITVPNWVTHMTREIILKDSAAAGMVDEKWIATNSATGCQDNVDPLVYSYYELNGNRGFASIQLIPDTTSCELNVTLSSAIRPEEVASDYWKSWKFEFFFSEIHLTPLAELRLKLRYREVDLDLDLGPYIRQTIAPDTLMNDTDGVFTFIIDESFASFQLNGNNWDPDFSAATGNVLSVDHNGSDPRFEVSLSSTQSKDQSYLAFQFLRISSYGIPEQ